MFRFCLWHVDDPTCVCLARCRRLRMLRSLLVCCDRPSPLEPTFALFPFLRFHCLLHCRHDICPPSTEEWLSFHTSLATAIDAQRHAIVVIDKDGRIVGDSGTRTRSLAALSRAEIIFVYTHLLEDFFHGETFAATREPGTCGGFQLITHNGDDHVGAAIAPATLQHGAPPCADAEDGDAYQRPGRMRNEACRRAGNADQHEGSKADRGRSAGAVRAGRAESWEEIAVSALDSSRITRWWAQNNLACHPRVWSVPIGVANSMWRHGDTATLARIAAT